MYKSEIFRKEKGSTPGILVDSNSQSRDNKIWLLSIYVFYTSKKILWKIVHDFFVQYLLGKSENNHMIF